MTVSHEIKDAAQSMLFFSVTRVKNISISIGTIFAISN